MKSPMSIAKFIDYTLLRPEATRADIERLCAEAREHGFAAVCVNACWVPLCAALMASSGTKVATVVGFPLGANATEVKVFEARSVVDAGADEIDLVASIGHIIDGDWAYVETDIHAVVETGRGKTIKVILETAVLKPAQISEASAISRRAGAHFVKTSTGFHSAGGATVEAVRLMRKAVGDSLGVKASGGIRDCVTALRMIAAGANRIGTSSALKLVQCLEIDPTPIEALLRDPSLHEHVCLLRAER